VRSVETALADGMPHAIIFGRVKFQVTVVEPWLEQRGYLTHRTGPADTLDDPIKRGGDTGMSRPRTRGVDPRASKEA
jgi:hypothetical protein